MGAFCLASDPRGGTVIALGMARDGEEGGEVHASADCIATERLVLEPLLGSHAELLFEELAEPQLYRWISAMPPVSVEALRLRWTEAERQVVSGGVDLQWAARRVSDGRYVGKLDAEVRGRVATNVGYIIFLPYWGQGYATEAVRAVAAQLERQGATEQRALVTRGNEASARVLAKAGFLRTRVIADNDVIRGQKHDDVEYVRRLARA
jgi:[ribosomal protein S5]-alanine N-acetyltransferase